MELMAVSQVPLAQILGTKRRKCGSMWKVPSLKETTMTLLQIAYLTLATGACLCAIGYFLAFLAVH